MSRAEYITRQRWFSGPVQPISTIESGAWLRKPNTGLGVRFERVTFRDGTVYNVPASYRAEPFPGLEGALMAREDGWWVYDALLDAHARTELLAGFTGRSTPGLQYMRLGDIAVGERPATVPLVAEQSNTSIVVGDALLAKFFRILVPGRNPDIELSLALSEAGSAHIAPIHGWISDDDADLAMLYEYYLSATDGWDSARTSFRDYLATAAGPPGHAGADFAPEATRLGTVIAEVHQELRALGTEEWDRQRLASLGEHLQQRFAQATEIAPELDQFASDVNLAYQELADISAPVLTQRIHGDLHLGQTLRTIDGWKLIDFEGEPGAALTERTRLDSPLRDLAGMLRSLDYAPHSVLMQTDQGDETSRARAAAWARRNHEALLAGYGVAADPASYVLLRCYQIDKAAYEVAYETRHRPAWATIPQSALQRLLADPANREPL